MNPCQCKRVRKIPCVTKIPSWNHVSRGIQTRTIDFRVPRTRFPSWLNTTQMCIYELGNKYMPSFLSKSIISVSPMSLVILLPSTCSTREILNETISMVQCANSSQLFNSTISSHIWMPLTNRVTSSPVTLWHQPLLYIHNQAVTRDVKWRDIWFVTLGS